MAGASESNRQMEKRNRGVSRQIEKYLIIITISLIVTDVMQCNYPMLFPLIFPYFSRTLFSRILPVCLYILNLVT